jgi:multidrug efflux pump subunit AcrA (membrane-fusion protein)
MSDSINSGPPRSRWLRRFLPIVLLGLAVAGFLLLRATRPEPPPAAAPEPSWRVQVVEVYPGRVAPHLWLYGTVEAPRQIELEAAVAAEVTHVPIQEGQTVAAGAALVVLDDRDLALILSQREAELRDLDAQIASERARHAVQRDALRREQALLALAERALERALDLHRQKMTSEAALDEARQGLERQALAVEMRQLEVSDHPARLAQLQARHARAAALRDQARLDRERALITAPFPGLVTRVRVAAGDRVRVGDPLLALYPVADLELRAQIPFRHLPALRAALVADAPPIATAVVDGRPVRAVLERLGGQTDSGRGGLDALLRVTAGEEVLEPGRVLALTLDLPPEDDVVALPFEALYGLNRVYRLEEGRLAALAVEWIGERHEAEGRTEVLVRGPELRAGDRIVTTQLPNAVTGLKVTVVE